MALRWEAKMCIRDSWDVVHRNFSVDVLKRTKGLLNGGKLEYGTVGEDGKIDKTREHIVWYFDTTYDEDETEE